MNKYPKRSRDLTTDEVHKVVNGGMDPAVLRSLRNGGDVPPDHKPVSERFDPDLWDCPKLFGFE